MPQSAYELLEKKNFSSFIQSYQSSTFIGDSNKPERKLSPEGMQALSHAFNSLKTLDKKDLTEFLNICIFNNIINAISFLLKYEIKQRFKNENYNEIATYKFEKEKLAQGEKIFLAFNKNYINKDINYLKYIMEGHPGVKNKYVRYVLSELKIAAASCEEYKPIISRANNILNNFEIINPEYHQKNFTIDAKEFNEYFIDSKKQQNKFSSNQDINAHLALLASENYFLISKWLGNNNEDEKAILEKIITYNINTTRFLREIDLISNSKSKAINSLLKAHSMGVINNINLNEEDGVLYPVFWRENGGNQNVYINIKFLNNLNEEIQPDENIEPSNVDKSLITEKMPTKNISSEKINFRKTLSKKETISDIRFYEEKTHRVRIIFYSNIKQKTSSNVTNNLTELSNKIVETEFSYEDLKNYISNLAQINMGALMKTSPQETIFLPLKGAKKLGENNIYEALHNYNNDFAKNYHIFLHNIMNRKMAREYYQFKLENIFINSKEKMKENLMNIAITKDIVEATEIFLKEEIKYLLESSYHTPILKSETKLAPYLSESTQKTLEYNKNYLFKSNREAPESPKIPTSPKIGISRKNMTKQILKNLEDVKNIQAALMNHPGINNNYIKVIISKLRQLAILNNDINNNINIAVNMLSHLNPTNYDYNALSFIFSENHFLKEKIKLDNFSDNININKQMNLLTGELYYLLSHAVKSKEDSANLQSIESLITLVTNAIKTLREIDVIRILTNENPSQVRQERLFVKHADSIIQSIIHNPSIGILYPICFEKNISKEDNTIEEKNIFLNIKIIIDKKTATKSADNNENSRKYLVEINYYITNNLELNNTENLIKFDKSFSVRGEISHSNLKEYIINLTSFNTNLFNHKLVNILFPKIISENFQIVNLNHVEKNIINQNRNIYFPLKSLYLAFEEKLGSENYKKYFFSKLEKIFDSIDIKDFRLCLNSLSAYILNIIPHFANGDRTEIEADLKEYIPNLEVVNPDIGTIIQRSRNNTLNNDSSSYYKRKSLFIDKTSPLRALLSPDLSRKSFNSRILEENNEIQKVR